MGRVVMVRGLPSGTEDTDLVRLGSCVARVMKTMVLKTKNMGFIEFQTEPCANAFLDKASRDWMMVRFQQVLCGPSTHHEITHTSALAVTEPLLRQLGIVTGAAVRAVPPSGAAPHSDAGPQPSRPPGTVLEVKLQGLMLPVKVDDLHPIFSAYGRVEKIEHQDGGRKDTFVQMSAPAEADAAIAALGGQFVGCATLLVSRSHIPELQFPQHTALTRDYERAGPPPANSMNPIMLGMIGVGIGGAGMQPPPPPPAAGGPGMPPPWEGGGGKGGWDAGGGPGGDPMAQMQRLMQMHAGAGFGQQRQRHWEGDFHHNGGGPPGPYDESDSGIVLLCSGLNDRITLNHLWELAGKVGDICTVKIMYTHRDKCLLHFADGRSGDQARDFLDGLELHGSTLRVSVSKQVPPIRIGQNDAGLIANKDSHRKHRFNPANAVPPGDTLHVSAQLRGGAPAELPGGMRECLLPLFRSHGGVLGFEQFKSRPNLCTIRMASTTAALDAMVALNGHPIDLSDGGRANLGIGFSKHRIDAGDLPEDPLAILNALRAPNVGGDF